MYNDMEIYKQNSIESTRQGLLRLPKIIEKDMIKGFYLVLIECFNGVSIFLMYNKTTDLQSWAYNEKGGVR